jgi:hypothetical protein
MAQGQQRNWGILGRSGQGCVEAPPLIAYSYLEPAQSPLRSRSPATVVTMCRTASGTRVSEGPA